MDQNYTFAELLPVCTCTNEHENPEEQMNEYQFEEGRFLVLLSDALPTRKNLIVKILKLEAIHRALRKILQPLNDTVRPELLVSVFEKQQK